MLQNIEVLSAGQNYQKDTEGKPATVHVVNLLVTPEQAEILSLAKNETRIQLVLRNPLDTEMSETPAFVCGPVWGTRSSGRAGRPRRGRTKAGQSRSEPAAAPEPPPPILIEVLNGPQRTEAKFARSAEGKN